MIRNLRLFCRSVPGVIALERHESTAYPFGITVNYTYYHEIRRTIFRWMRKNGRCFQMTWNPISDPLLPPLDHECPAFEAFCRSIPGVLDVTLIGIKPKYYLITLERWSIRQEIYRWLHSHGFSNVCRFDRVQTSNACEPREIRPTETDAKLSETNR